MLEECCDTIGCVHSWNEEASQSNTASNERQVVVVDLELQSWRRQMPVTVHPPGEYTKVH